MKHGTILRNLWQPSYKSYFVYTKQLDKLTIVMQDIDDEIHLIRKRTERKEEE